LHEFSGSTASEASSGSDISTFIWTHTYWKWREGPERETYQNELMEAVVIS
jgi:hypothetical protein